MVEPTDDNGAIFALLERFRTQRLPRALAIKEKVDQGGKLDDSDIAFLDTIFKDAQQITPLLDTHPEYQELAARAMHLYKEITQRALDNERKG